MCFSMSALEFTLVLELYFLCFFQLLKNIYFQIVCS